jgi:hypothetical protein
VLHQVHVDFGRRVHGLDGLGDGLHAVAAAHVVDSKGDHLETSFGGSRGVATGGGRATGGCISRA